MKLLTWLLNGLAAKIIKVAQALDPPPDAVVELQKHIACLDGISGSVLPHEIDDVQDLLIRLTAFQEARGNVSLTEELDELRDLLTDFRVICLDPRSSNSRQLRRAIINGLKRLQRNIQNPNTGDV